MDGMNQHFRHFILYSYKCQEHICRIQIAQRSFDFCLVCDLKHSHFRNQVNVNQNPNGLTLNEFCMGMHLLKQKRSGMNIPTTLPPHIVSQLRSFPPSTESVRRAESSFDTAGQYGMLWTIKPDEKSNFDGYFAGLDKFNRGTLTCKFV